MIHLHVTQLLKVVCVRMDKISVMSNLSSTIFWSLDFPGMPCSRQQCSVLTVDSPALGMPSSLHSELGNSVATEQRLSH